MSRVSNSPEIDDDQLLVDLVRLVGAAIPIERGLALLLLFAGDIVEEVVVAGEAAAIFGRASPLSAEELRA